MSSNQHSATPMSAPGPLRRHGAPPARRLRWRRPIRLLTYAGAAFWCALAASVATGSGAVAAASTTTTQSFTVAGKYQVTVPANAIQVQIEGVGGAGTAGTSSDGQGGAAGSGTDVSETAPVAPGGQIVPGENLTVIVGSRGGGGHGGAGGLLAGAGGSGGGATQVLSPYGDAALIAGGGGGGGGGAGVYPGPGGAGGTDSNGTATSIAGNIAARGGTAGGRCGSSAPALSQGEVGESDTSGDSGGGGGGGGEGWCGGQSGGSGDHGAGKYVDGAGGGGGGAGGNAYLSNATSLSITGSSNTGDGSLTVTFTLAAPATATLSSETISFPDQQVGTTGQTQYVTLTNNGDLPLSFEGLSTTGDAADDFVGSFGTCGPTIAAHSSCQLGASFRPTASGDRSTTLVVSDNAPDGPQKIILTGQATSPPAPATATPSTANLMFGGQEIGTTSATKQVTLTNNGDLPLTLGGVSVSGPNAADYTADATRCMGGGGPGWNLLEGPPTLAPHTSCVIDVKLTPHGPRMRNATLVVADSAPDSPQHVALTGTGLLPPEAVLEATAIAFGAQQLGTSSQAQYVTLDNKGDVPMTITGIALSGQDAGDFTGDLGTCGSSLAAHHSCELGASFRPTTAGERSATLLISDNAPASPQQITLGGTGTPAPAGPQSTTTTTASFTVSAPSTDSAPPLTTTTPKRIVPKPMCVVPRLRHMTLAQARRALSHAHCGLGTVRRPAHLHSHHALHVARQSSAAGARKQAGYPVSIWLIG